MNISFKKVENGEILLIGEDLKPGNWQEKSDWMDIRTKDRKEIIRYFKENNIYSEFYKCIEFPESYPFSNTFGEIIILNISISSAPSGMSSKILWASNGP